jgi:hypothetical protein
MTAQLQKIRLELARTKDAPDGDPHHGYELVAPLDKDGHLDSRAWPSVSQLCTVRRFAPDENEEHGLLIHSRGKQWAFSYEIGEEDDEPIYRLGEHRFAVGEYVSITEHDGITRPFRVVSVAPHRIGG